MTLIYEKLDIRKVVEPAITHIVDADAVEEGFTGQDVGGRGSIVKESVA